MKISYYFTVMTPMPVALNQLLTEISRVSMVEALQLACLSLSESNRRRISSFFDFLSHVVNNKHLIIACDMMSRSSVSSALNLTVLAYCFFLFITQVSFWNETDTRKILAASPLGELDETTRTPSYYLYVGRKANWHFKANHACGNHLYKIN